MTEIVTVEILCPDADSAARIAAAALDRRLAACANIAPGVTSHYTWNGARETAAEVALSLKTRAALFAPLAELACDLHPYELPCVLAHPIVHVTEAYHAWVIAVTREP